MNNVVNIKISLDEGAEMPVRAHNTDTGYDVKANKVKLEYCQDNMSGGGHVWKYIIDTGVHVQPEEGYYVIAAPNSRVSKLPVYLGNSIGVIDQGYTGSIRFIYSLHPGADPDMLDEFFSTGKVCGQLIIMKRYDALFDKVDKLEETDRGNGGFGSTAK